MPSIIQELQIEAARQSGSVTELLRKAKIVASKLDLQEFLEWIENELNGYKETDYKKYPPYRFINGEPKGWNPYHGWLPLIFSHEKSQEILSQMPTNQPIGQLEDLYSSGNSNLQIPYAPKAQNKISEATGSRTKFTLMIDRSAVAGVLDAVRNIILDWSLKLEKEGVLGEGISFSQDDKKKAHEQGTLIKINKISNFVGNVGNVADQASINISQVTQTDVEQIKHVIGLINEHLNTIGLKENEVKLVKEKIGDIETEIIKNDPQKLKLNQYFGSIKKIFEGAAGSIIAQGILYSIEKLF